MASPRSDIAAEKPDTTGIMPRRSGVLFPVLLFGTLSGCGSAEQDRAPPDRAQPEAFGLRIADGHERMLGLLRRIKERVPRANPYLGDAAVRRLRARMAGLQGEAVPQWIDLAKQTGEQEVLLGNLAEGIDKLEAAHALALRAGDQVPPDSLLSLAFSLGVSYMRLAETENCVEAHTSESCIFPIRGDGVHVHKDAALKAIEHYSRVLELRPEHLKARWLLNLAYMTVGRYPDGVPERFLILPEAFESEAEFPPFVDRAPELGLNTFSHAGGSVVDDFDNDGFLDIVVSTWNPAGQIRYFHNDGDGTFSERTEQAGLAGIYGGLNLVQADYDNDGAVDVLVLRGAWLGGSGRHPNSLLRNDGTGGFRDVTFDAGLGDDHYPTQTASWADYDNDGDLDLYVGNENFSNQLYGNRGDGTFVDVAAAALVDDEGYAKGVVWGDYDGDRFPDLYVSNMGHANRLYHNQGNGTFVDVAAELGVRGPRFSFPVWFWDFDNDGALDLFAASFRQDLALVPADYLGLPHQAEMDCLYQGDGRGGFREVAAERNLRRVTQPMGSNFGDLDNDGFLDFYLGTGYPDYESLVPNLMFRNDRGTGFLDVTTAGGFGHLQKGHGVAFADLDNDGDQDVFLEVGGWYAGDAYGDALFENPGFGNHWIAVRLVGTVSNAAAIGARIRIVVAGDNGSERSIYRWVTSGGSFGGNPLRQQIGLGKAESIARLDIFWPTTGRTQVFRDVAVNQFIEITEGKPDFRRMPWKTVEFAHSRTPGSHRGHHPTAPR